VYLLLPVSARLLAALRVQALRVLRVQALQVQARRMQDAACRRHRTLPRSVSATDR
jgi:hypothetical protein